MAKRGQPHGSGLGKFRWVVERSISWLHQFRRLRIRYERRDDIHEAFLIMGCAFDLLPRTHKVIVLERQRITAQRFGRIIQHYIHVF